MDGDNELADASINLEGSADHINQLPYNCRIEVKQSAQLIIDNASDDGAVMHFQDIKIVPYLLFTTKSDEAFLSLVDEYDIKNVLINNTDDGEVVYSILTADAQSQISNEGVVSFTNVTKSETITIQAAWTPDGESSATVITTMTLYVDVESKTDKTVEEEFSNYGDTGWIASEANEVTKNGDVYDWRTKLTRHKTSDKLVDNQQAIWFAQNGYVATADATDNTKVGPAEGGIKRIAFDWNQHGADQTGDDLYISISVDGEEVSAIRRDGGEQPTEPWQYIHNLNVKKNATLKIENKSTASKNEGGRVKIGTIVITPYLLYTVKDTAIDMTKVATFTNDQLIDNRDDATAIIYSIIGENDGVATINATTGVVTCQKVGVVTVQAAWGDVTTTYELEVIYSKQDPELAFAPEEITVGVNETTITTPTLSNPHELTVTYSSSDEDIATVDENTGEVTLKGVTGEVTISAHSDETDMYEAGNASYTLTVMDFALWQTVRTDGAAGNWNTICLERNITAIDGATFWTISGQDANSFILDEVTEPQAGYGYLIRFTAAELKVKYGSETAATPVEASYDNPIQGTFTLIDFDKTTGENELVGNYVVYNNQLCPVEGWVGLRANRAYVKADYVPDNAPAPAPGRARAYMPKPKETPTDLDRLTDSPTPRFTKYIKDGQLVIVKDGKRYNALGF